MNSMMIRLGHINVQVFFVLIDRIGQLTYNNFIWIDQYGQKR